MLGRNALVVEGGALRSVFSAGLLDGFLQQDFKPFDWYIGVSAGASNLLFYLSGLQGGAYRLFQDITAQRHFINYSRFIRGGHLLDMDWLFERVQQSELDQLLRQQQHPLLVTMTDVHSGRAVYNDLADDDIFPALRASMSLPLIYRGFPEYRGRAMTDGGIADGIPVAEAIRRGASNIMVVRSRHADYIKTDTIWHRYIRWKMREYPALVATMQQRIQIHEDSKQLIRQQPAGVSIVDVCPPADFAMTRFSRNPDQIEQGYQLGLQRAPEVIEQWRQLREQ